MAIRDWPADTRPREKLLHQGAGALTDAELVAVFLRTGVVGKSAVDLGASCSNVLAACAVYAAPIKNRPVPRPAWAKPNTHCCKP